MTVADSFGSPLAACAASATPHEGTLVAPTRDSRFVHELPRCLFDDRAPSLRACVSRGSGWTPPPKVPSMLEARAPIRLVGQFRCLGVRYERHSLNYLGLVHLGHILILLRRSL